MDLLRQQVRVAVRNGRLTERGLAIRIGVSQPYLHNVLKGKRSMTAELADRLLREMRMGVADLAAMPLPPTGRDQGEATASR
ncbi:MAG: helix-turn-helix transcriptional regulator [Bryobacterales bacterium]|nr:helix-turn-helix transcriptional regulator [Bryobacterales bacterium]